MHYEFDPVKDAMNIDKHGLSLADADGFEWEAAVVREDTRKRYAEPRFEAKGYIGDRLHVWCIACVPMQCVSSVCARPTPER